LSLYFILYAQYYNKVLSFSKFSTPTYKTLYNYAVDYFYNLLLRTAILLKINYKYIFIIVIFRKIKIILIFKKE